MDSEKYEIVRERLSFHGRMWRILLWAWEVITLSAFAFAAAVRLDHFSSLSDPMDRTVYARSTVTIWVFILVAWFVGTVLFALGTFLTRPAKFIVPIGSQHSSED